MITVTRQHGFSLIELLITCVISSVLLLILTKTLIIQHRTYLSQQALARLQENGRFASMMLNQHIGKAGYVGCGRLGQLLNWSNQTTQPLGEVHVIRGYQAIDQHWQPGLPMQLHNKVKTESDVIELNYADRLGYLAAATTDLTQLTVYSDQHIYPKHVLLISDCQYADVVIVDAVNKIATNTYTITLASPLQHHYSAMAFIGKVVQLFFYIGDTQRVNMQKQPIYALYMRNQDGHHVELVPGVHAMHIYYSTRQYPTHYHNASSISVSQQWPHVIMVNIELLLNSIDALPYRHGELLEKTWDINSTLLTRLSLCNKGLC